MPTRGADAGPIALDTMAVLPRHVGGAHDADEDARQVGSDQRGGACEDGNPHGTDGVDPRVFTGACTAIPDE